MERLVWWSSIRSAFFQLNALHLHLLSSPVIIGWYYQDSIRIVVKTEVMSWGMLL